MSTVATPSRTVQAMVDVLLKAAPFYARTERERRQADEVYKAGTTINVM
jgi:E3 ubiquitin-protein ligase CHFR